jgi:hypothetical protein
MIEEFNSIDFLSQSFIVGNVYEHIIGETPQSLTIKTIFRIENETFIVYSYQNSGVKDKSILIGTRRAKYLKYNVIDLPGFYQILYPNAPVQIQYIQSGSN